MTNFIEYKDLVENGEIFFEKTIRKIMHQINIEDTYHIASGMGLKYCAIDKILKFIETLQKENCYDLSCR